MPEPAARLSPRKLAERLGVRLAAVQYAIRTGRLEGTFERDPRGRYHFDAEAALERWASTSKTGRGAGLGEDSGDDGEGADDSELDKLLEAAAVSGDPVDQLGRLLAPDNLGRLKMHDATRVEKILKALILRLEYQKAAGALVLKSAVEQAAYDEAKRVRQALSAIPSRMRSQGLDAAHAKALGLELERALEGLAK